MDYPTHLLSLPCVLHFSRLFAEKFSAVSVDLECVSSMMSKHSQYSCMVQISEQLASDGQVRV